MQHSWWLCLASLRTVHRYHGELAVGKHAHVAPDDEQFVLYATGAALLVLFAGLASGLTLGLMSLDSTQLEVRVFF